MLPLQDFLQNFWPELRAVHELYASVGLALQEKLGEGSQREYAEHLHARVLEAGIKAGRYIQVQERLGRLPRTFRSETAGQLHPQSETIGPMSLS